MKRKIGLSYLKECPGAYIFQRTFSRAYFRREISVSKLAGLIIGGKFVSTIFQCANDNIGALTRNS